MTKITKTVEIMGCDLTDVELVVDQKATATRVYVEDLRGVGGPMGSEHVTTIYEQTFENGSVAVGFAMLLIRRALDGCYKADEIKTKVNRFEADFNRDGKNYLDCAAIGVGIRPVVIEVVTGFSQNVPATVREVIGEA